MGVAEKLAEREINEWLTMRKQAGLTIDPETAEVQWWYARTVDPYGVSPELPKECDVVGREYFARSAGSEMWVSFDDLPAPIREALWNKLYSKEAFFSPAGEELPWD